MLARIKFVDSRSNRLSPEELSRLEEFLGEKIETQQLKINEDGKEETLFYRETFDQEKAKKDTDYTLVVPSENVQISSSDSYIVELEKFISEFPSLEINIRGTPKAVQAENMDLIRTMENVANKIEEAKNKFDKVIEFNQKCDVHVPNLGLMNINKLAFATDYCTEALQQLLFKGWRLIAVCPQPNQRRPDYILGMHVADFDGDVTVQSFHGSGEER